MLAHSMSPSKLTLSLRITGYPAASKGALFTDLCKSVVDEIPPASLDITTVWLTSREIVLEGEGGSLKG